MKNTGPGSRDIKEQARVRLTRLEDTLEFLERELWEKQRRDGYYKHTAKMPEAKRRETEAMVENMLWKGRSHDRHLVTCV